MAEEAYVEVDDYLEGLFPPDPVLDSAQRRAADAGLPDIAVSLSIGRLLHVLARVAGARRVLEIGTLAGVSAIWLARALPDDGRLLSLEVADAHAEVARANLADAGLDDRVEVRVGPALTLLDELIEQGAEPFDLVFIDADKAPYPDYLDAAVRLSRPGTLIVADNVVRAGRVAREPDNDDIAGLRRFNTSVAADDRLDAAIVQVVGAKGHDGLAFARVR
jgi:predicted O-methyltransferase YrrM